MPFPQVRELYGQVLDLFCQFKDLCGQVQELCGQAQELCAQVARVVKRTSRNVRPNKRGSSVTLNMPPSVLNLPFTYAYIRIYFPEKAFTSFTQSAFPIDFQHFLCEGLFFKAFTRAVNARDGRREQTFTPGNRIKIRK